MIYTSYNYNKVFFNTLSVDPNSFGSSSVSAYVPSSLGAGNYTLSVSNGMDTVKLPGALKVVVPTITGISPTSGYPGTDLTISGHNFNTGSSYVYIGSYSYYAYSNDSTTFKITIPSYLAPGTYKVSVNGGNNQIYSPTDFIVLAPTLTSITPATGTVGTAVIIKGEGFRTNASNVSV